MAKARSYYLGSVEKLPNAQPWPASGAASSADDWTPAYSWHGFRYIELTVPHGVSVDADAVECYPMRTDVELIANFSSSDPFLEQLRVSSPFSSTQLGGGCSSINLPNADIADKSPCRLSTATRSTPTCCRCSQTARTESASGTAGTLWAAARRASASSFLMDVVEWGLSLSLCINLPYTNFGAE